MKPRSPLTALSMAISHALDYGIETPGNRRPIIDEIEVQHWAIHSWEDERDGPPFVYATHIFFGNQTVDYENGVFVRRFYSEDES